MSLLTLEILVAVKSTLSDINIPSSDFLNNFGHVYQFPRAAAIKYHKISGLKQQQFSPL